MGCRATENISKLIKSVHYFDRISLGTPIKFFGHEVLAHNKYNYSRSAQDLAPNALSL
jgi:hypothetical protein